MIRAFSDEMESVRAASSLDSPPPCGNTRGREQTECVAPLCINLIGKRSNMPPVVAIRCASPPDQKSAFVMEALAC
jgi:hypothetical protein